MNGEIYLSGEDVCKLLHISRRTLQQYRDDQILPYIQIGGKIIFKQTDLLRILEQNYVCNGHSLWLHLCFMPAAKMKRSSRR